MSTFTQDKTAREPFGRNEFRRSTKDIKDDSYTFYHGGIPAQDIDGSSLKVLQPGTVIAKIISGPGAGMVGVFQGVGADEVHTLNPSSGAGEWAGGTYDLNVLGFDVLGLAVAATASTIQAAIRAAVAAGDTAGDYDDITITVTGGPLSTNTNVVITFNGTIGVDVPVTTIDVTDVTVGGTCAVTTSTPGVAGATDGRGDTANIVGINQTFVPWQLNERDVEISVVYEATVVQDWCIEYTAAGVPTALGNTTRDAMLALAATKNISYK